jgi:hypothetical protein
MRHTTKLAFILGCLATAFLLSGCLPGEPDPSKQVVIPKSYNFDVIHVSGAKEVGVDRESTTQLIKDEKKIKSFIRKVSGLELVELSPDESLNRMEELETPGSYVIYLHEESDTEDSDRSFQFYFYKDGSLQVNQLDNGIYFVKNDQPKLLAELKASWGIEF